MPVWKKLTQKQHQKITSLCEVLDDRFCLNANGDVRQPFLIDMKKTNKALENWLEKKRIEAIKASDVALDTFRRRSAVIGFRAAMLASVLYEGAKVVTKRINAFAVFIADTALAALLNKFGNAVRQLPTTEHGTTTHVTLFDMMKDTFTREELNAALATTKRETPARKVVSNWMQAGLIEKVGKSVWRKKK